MMMGAYTAEKKPALGQEPVSPLMLLVSINKAQSGIAGSIHRDENFGKLGTSPLLIGKAEVEDAVDDHATLNLSEINMSKDHKANVTQTSS